LRYEQANATKDKKEKIMFIHTSMTVYGDSDIGRRRVLQIKTNAPKSPFVAESYMRNVMFEREVLAKWKGEVPGVAPVLPEYAMGTAGVAPIVPATNPLEEKEDVNECLITFNPKELLLLEKAFDNALTPRDLKSKAEKWTDEDQKKCQLTILRAKSEFKYVFPRKPNRRKSKSDENSLIGKNENSDSSKKTATKKKSSTLTKKSVAQTASKKAETKKEKSTKELPKNTKRASVGKNVNGPATKKSAMKLEKRDEPVDSDDEPIAMLKTPSKKAKSKVTAPKKTHLKKESTRVVDTSKKATPSKKASAQAKGKGVKHSATKKRGRDKSVEPSSKKTRSGSKSRNTRS